MPVVLQNRFGFLLDCGLLEGFLCSPQASVMAGKVPEVGVLGPAEKKVKILEQQRMEVGGWTGWSVSTLLPSWDQRDEGSAWLSGSR